MEKRYAGLRLMIWLFRLSAVLVSLGGLVYGLINALFGLVVGALIGAMMLYAFGELLNLFIDVEENTRRTNALLERLPRNNGTRKLPSKDGEDEPLISSIVQKNR